jgi:phage shock protein PspC (stress-responsive transcriptional regulator)
MIPRFHGQYTLTHGIRIGTAIGGCRVLRVCHTGLVVRALRGIARIIPVPAVLVRIASTTATAGAASSVVLLALYICQWI